MAKAFLVGAGPGDPRLLTLAAVEALQAADVILCDRLVSQQILCKANPAAKIIYVGKGPGEQDHVQEQIFEYLREYAEQDVVVVRLKGGDPYVFGRGSEEHDHLTELGYEVTVVPGITSALGVPAIAGIPMTARGVSTSFAVVTGHLCKDKAVDWSSFVGIDTLVVLMGVSERSKISARLIELGRSPSEPVAFIENGSCENQRIVRSTLGAVRDGLVEVASPAVFVIGGVANLHKRATTARTPDQAEGLENLDGLDGLQGLKGLNGRELLEDLEVLQDSKAVVDSVFEEIRISNQRVAIGKSQITGRSRRSAKRDLRSTGPIRCPLLRSGTSR